MQQIMRMVLAGWLLAPAVSGAADTDAATLLDKAGTGGGLCLVIGARDTALATELASRSTLYVQVLQPDAKLALQWGAALAASTNREQVGVRSAAFDPAHYGASLFNLIVVEEDAAALGQAKLADLCRILVPNGVVAFKKMPQALVAAAKALGASNGVAGAYTFCRAPGKPVVWKPDTETKWQAGPRSQIANGYSGVCTGDGKLFYLEQTERNEGDLNNCAAVLWARDAHNGRTLWTRELPGRYVRNSYFGLVSTSKGRLFVKSVDGPLLCMDGNTGKTLLEVCPTVHREFLIWLLNDDFLCINGDVRSTETGKPLWKYPVQHYQPLPGTIIGTNVFFYDGVNIFAKRVATGEDLWKVGATNTLPRAVERLSAVGSNLLVHLAAEGKADAPFAVLDSSRGKLLWSSTWKVTPGKEEERYYKTSAGTIYHAVDGKLLLTIRHNQPDKYQDEIAAARFDLATGAPEFTDKIIKTIADFHGCFGGHTLGDYYVEDDLWLNLKTLEATPWRMPHPACFFGSHVAYGLVYDFPSRKSGPITAVGTTEVLPPATGKAGALVKFGPAPAAKPVATGDWPVFRGNAAGGNSTAAKPGKDLKMLWSAKVGLGNTSFGVMSSQRTGLTQPVLAYGLAIAADIDGQRIVAINAADGTQKWIYAVGSRVDYPPTLYNGLCLIAARDGCVHVLDAATGSPVYKLNAAARERYVGGWEKLESRWPLASDVLIAGGTAYVAGGDGGGLTFQPETGERIEDNDARVLAMGAKQIPGGRELRISYDVVIKGNSIPRTNEDNWEGFSRARFHGKLDARVLAFDDTLTVAYQFRPAGEGWANAGKLTLKGIADNPAKPVWTSEPIELVVDDIVLTPVHIYCAGHFQRVKKTPEIWVLSREDGKVLNTIPVDGFPAFLGMSAAENRLFVATREGKLICYENKAP